MDRRKKVTAAPKRPYAERQGVLMTPAEAGDYLAVTERQIRRLVHERRLSHVRVGGLLRLRVVDLDGYVEASRTEASGS